METSSVSASKSFTTLDMVYIAIFAVLITVCSWISIPTAVPFTLQTFGIFVTAEILGGKKATLSVIVFLLLGAVGVPVFAGFTGGIGILLGNTGGYLIGFVFTELFIWLSENLFGRKPVVRIVTMVIGLIICYAFGTVWFMKVYAGANGAISLSTALGWCVLPFIIPDLIKIALAFAVGSRVKKAMGIA